MSHIISRCKVLEVVALLAGLLLWPAMGAAQNVSGQAQAIQATVMGATTVLADARGKQIKHGSGDAARL